MTPTKSSGSPERLPKLTQLLEDFRSIEDFDEKAEWLIEIAERFQEVPEEIATRPFPETQRVPACESEAFAWVTPSSEGLKFYFAVENPQGISAKAMAVILSETLSGESAEAIQNVSEEIVFDIFGQGLSMGKGLGLKNMVGFVKNLSREL